MTTSNLPQKTTTLGLLSMLGLVGILVFSSYIFIQNIRNAPVAEQDIRAITSKPCGRNAVTSFFQTNQGYLPMKRLYEIVETCRIQHADVNGVRGRQMNAVSKN